MSVESAISNLLSTLRSMAGSYRTSATSLIQNADTLLQSMETPAAVNTTFEVDRDSPPLIRIPSPPTLANLSDLTIPPVSDLQGISQITGHFTGVAPTLALPDFDYPDLTDAPDFTGTTPNITALTIHPTAPTLIEADKPTLTEPVPVTVDPYSSTLPTIPQPTFTPFVGDFEAEYHTALGWVSGEIAEWSLWMDDLRDRLAPVEASLTPRLLAILNGTEPGVPDTWETGQYEQSQQAIRVERYAALTALDDQVSAITGLPDGRRTYAQVVLELKTLQADMEAAAKVTNARHELEVKHLEWAMELIAKLTDLALELKLQEVGWRIKGLLLALEGASETADVALKILAFKEKELALLTRYNQAQIARLDLAVKMELTKLDVLKLDIANNKLIGGYNEQQAKLYQLAAGWLELRVKRYQAQMEYLQTDVGWRQLIVDQFTLRVQAYQARMKTVQAEVAAQRAKIKGDLALVDAELAKVDQYNAAWTALAAEAKANIAKVQAQAAANRSALAAYNATVAAKLDYLRLLQNEARLALKALVKGYSLEVSEQQINLANQQLEDQDALNTALTTLQEEQLELQRTLQTHQVQLSRVSAQGQIMNSGASTLSGIAKQAYGGLNAVGVMETLEEAA